MASITLHVPSQTLERSSVLDLRPRPLQAWIAALPVVNIPETTGRVLLALGELNRVIMPLDRRLASLDMLTPATHELITSLKQSYATASPPLTKKQLGAAGSVQSLLRHLGDGYKVVLSQALKEDGHAKRLFPAVQRAMDYLGQRLVEAYRLYLPEPTGIWGDLHLLYLLAERHGFHKSRTSGEQERSRAPSPRPSVEQLYKRLLLVNLANPYQLMRGEAVALYHQVDAWADHCLLLDLPKHQVPRRQFFVDFATDGPPHYCPANCTLAPMHARTIDPSAILPILDRLAHGTTSVTDRPQGTGGSTLSDRLHRQLYLRLRNAWEAPRQERVNQRVRSRETLFLVTGLSVCHHLFNGTLTVVGMSSCDELGPVRLTPYAAESDNGDADQAAGEHNNELWAHRASARLPKLTIEEDAADDTRSEGGLDEQEQTCIVSSWQQRDESLGGLGLFCFGESQPRIQVGEIVAFGSGRPDQGSPWQLGVVRWVRTRPAKGLDLGVARIAANAVAVLTGAVSGVGRGATFYRSLLLWSLPSEKRAPTLLTPSGIYDEGTVLSVQGRGRPIVNSRLTKMVDATHRFTRFEFVEEKDQ